MIAESLCLLVCLRLSGSWWVEKLVQLLMKQITWNFCRFWLVVQWPCWFSRFWWLSWLLCFVFCLGSHHQAVLECCWSYFCEIVWFRRSLEFSLHLELISALLFRMVKWSLILRGAWPWLNGPKMALIALKQLWVPLVSASCSISWTFFLGFSLFRRSSGLQLCIPDIPGVYFGSWW